MKVYCFYLVLDQIDPEKYPGIIADTVAILDGRDYSLYAYTQNKEFYKIFHNTRNPDKFICRIINVDDFDEFVDKYDAYLLEYHSLRTKDIRKGKETFKSIEVLMTRAESDYILYYSENRLIDELDGSIECSEDVVHILTNRLFKNSLNKSLDLLNFYTAVEELYYPTDIPYNDIFWVDHLSMFVRIFGNTFKKGVDYDRGKYCSS